MKCTTSEGLELNDTWAFADVMGTGLSQWNVSPCGLRASGHHADCSTCPHCLFKVAKMFKPTERAFTPETQQVTLK